MIQTISSKPDVAQHTARLIKKDYEIFHDFTPRKEQNLLFRKLGTS